VLLDAAVFAASARGFASQPPAHLVDGDVVRIRLVSREVINGRERGGASADDGELDFGSRFSREFHQPLLRVVQHTDAACTGGDCAASSKPA
jgi:hypothetical protein